MGIPGETDKDFARLLRFVREERLDNVGVFEYFREPGTSAAGGKKPRPGDFVRVRLTSARGYARTGVLL